jgi:hypothetical protein
MFPRSNRVHVLKYLDKQIITLESLKIEQRIREQGKDRREKIIWCMCVRIGINQLLKTQCLASIRDEGNGDQKLQKHT